VGFLRIVEERVGHNNFYKGGICFMLMKVVDWIRRYSTTREIQAVFLENGVRFKPHAVTEYYDLKGKYIGASFGGKLTSREKKSCEKNPELIKSSPFSYAPLDELDLPLIFARTNSAIMETGLSKKLN